MTLRCLFNEITTVARCFIRDRSGATAVEYALIAALIAGVLAAGYFAAGEDLGILYQKIANLIETLHSKRGL